MEEFFRKTTDEIMDDFQIGLQGLNDSQVETMRSKYGSNEFRESKKRSSLMVFLSQFKYFFDLDIVSCSITFWNIREV